MKETCFRCHAVLLLVLLMRPAYSQSKWSYPGCDDVTDADFTQEFLIGKTGILNPKLVDPGLMEPIELDLNDDGEGNVDIYFCERRGNLKMYDASENKLITLGVLPAVWSIPNRAGLDLGFDGLVLGPNFKTTGWIYLFYTPIVPAVEEEAYRIERYTIKNNQLDINTKKTIWEEEIRYDNHIHQGGSMEFDKYGDLWVVCSKNCRDDPNSMTNSQWASCEYSSSYFKTARGGAIRIHPIPFPDSETPAWGIGRTYTIPKGNLGDYYALKYEKEGDPARAAEFRDTSLVAPELFAKGMRNPWTMAIEPVRRWLAWGENGINRGYNQEEHNLTKIPGFFGYPYFAGSPDITTCNDGTITCVSGYNISARMGSARNYILKEEWIQDPLAPVNKSQFNDGLVDLPPAIPAIYAYRQSSAMTGPIYRYDGDLDSEVKFPPHFDHMWFLFDFNRGKKPNAPGGGNQTGGVTKAARLDDTQSRIVENQDIFQPPAHSLYSLLDAEMGPDGAMYIINYAGWFNTHMFQSISRMIYTGNCRPPEPKLEEKVNPQVYYPPPGYGCLTPGDANYDQNAYAHDAQACAGFSGIQNNQNRFPRVGASFQMNTLAITDAGPHTVRILDMLGTERTVYHGEGKASYRMVTGKFSGIHIVQVRTPMGSVVRKFAGL